jgi:hypothetical protein
MQGIIIRLVIGEEKNFIVVKLKDNGLGFKDLKSSESYELREYLDKHILINENSKKGKQKQQGLSFIMGGCSMGLDNMEIYISKIGGMIKIKNRKMGGASIECKLPNSNQLLFECALDCEHCGKFYKNILWNSKTKEPDAMYCDSCNKYDFFNPFRYKR